MRDETSVAGLTNRTTTIPGGGTISERLWGDKWSRTTHTTIYTPEGHRREITTGYSN